MSFFFEFFTYEKLYPIIISLIVFAVIFLTETIIKRLIHRFSERTGRARACFSLGRRL